MKIVGYKIVREQRIISFEEKIQREIEQGWQPLGSILQFNFELLQTMVKYEDIETNNFDKKTVECDTIKEY